MELADRLRLPLSFDVGAMLADLAAIEAGGWTEHFVRQNYEGSWSAIALRAAEGETHPIRMIYSDPMAQHFVDAPALALAPYLRQVIGCFGCGVQSVRLMRLAAGSVIKPHRDHDLDCRLGKTRIHVPILTHPGVEFRLNGHAVTMAAGEAWYLRLSDEHCVANRGARDRVHLVVDATVERELAALLAAASEPAMGAT